MDDVNVATVSEDLFSTAIDTISPTVPFLIESTASIPLVLTPALAACMGGSADLNQDRQAPSPSPASDRRRSHPEALSTPPPAAKCQSVEMDHPLQAPGAGPSLPQVPALPVPQAIQIDLATLRALIREEQATVINKIDEANTSNNKRFEMLEQKTDVTNNRVDALETRVARLEMKAPSTSSGGPPSVAGSSSTAAGYSGPRGRFVPRFFVVKQWCKWEERGSHGFDDNEIADWMAKAKEAVSANLKDQFDGFVSKSFRSVSFEIWPKNPKATLEIMLELLRAFRISAPPGQPHPQEHLKIHGKFPSLATEKSPQEAPMFQSFGEALGAFKRLMDSKGRNESAYSLKPIWRERIECTVSGRTGIIARWEDSMLKWNHQALQELETTEEEVKSHINRPR